ncbi:hypothetical protein HK099_001897, partial [Clydaea vesicula]
MVLKLAEEIPRIEAKFSNKEVFNHVEKFDSYVSTSKRHSLYHEELCLMSSYNKLADSHQLQCQIHFNVKADWSTVSVKNYRGWLVDYFRIYDHADKNRAVLLNSSTKQIYSARQFYAYICSLARQIPSTDQLQHDVQLCFVRGIHHAIAQSVFQLYEGLTSGQNSGSKFLHQVEWSAFLKDAFTLDEKFGYKPVNEKENPIIESKVNSVSNRSSYYPTSAHLQNLAALDGYDPAYRTGALRGRPEVAQWLLDNNVCLFHRILLLDCKRAGLPHSRYNFFDSTLSDSSFLLGKSEKDPFKLVRGSLDSKLKNKVIPVPINKISSFTFQQNDYGSYTLDPKLFQSILLQLNFTPKVDLFADPSNKKVFHYFTRTLTANCTESNGFLGVNSYNFTWNKFKNVYANPVFKDIELVLHKVCLDNVEKCLLIFPQLPIGNPIRTKLELYSICKPLLLPDSKNIWKPKYANKSHAKPPWRIAAYLLSGRRNRFGTSFTQYTELPFPGEEHTASFSENYQPNIKTLNTQHVQTIHTANILDSNPTVTDKKLHTTLGEGDSLQKLSSPKRNENIKLVPKSKIVFFKESYSTIASKALTNSCTKNPAPLLLSKQFTPASLTLPNKHVPPSFPRVPNSNSRTAKKPNTTLGGEDSRKKLSPPKRETSLPNQPTLIFKNKNFSLADSQLKVLTTTKSFCGLSSAKLSSNALSLSQFSPQQHVSHRRVISPTTAPATSFSPIQPPISQPAIAKKTLTTLGGED